MTKFVLSALVGLLALGLVAGTHTAQGAPAAPMRCTGANGVWDDTDIVHLTKQGAGTLTMGWTAHAQMTLTCTTGASTTTQVAQIEQRMQVHIMANGVATQGQGQVRISVGNRKHVFTGRYKGTTTVNDGALSLSGDFNADGDVDGADFLLMRQHGTVDRGTRQFTGFYIDDIIIGLK